MTMGVHISTKTAVAIVNAVARETSVPVDIILRRGGPASAYNARAEVYRRLRQLGASYHEIGRVMQRDHSTVMGVLSRRAEIIHRCKIASPILVEA